MDPERATALATTSKAEHPAHINNRLNLAYKLIRYCERNGIVPVDMVGWTDEEWIPHVEKARLNKVPSGKTLRAVLQITADRPSL